MRLSLLNMGFMLSPFLVELLGAVSYLLMVRLALLLGCGSPPRTNCSRLERSGMR
jgi:hypothetical protein